MKNRPTSNWRRALGEVDLVLVHLELLAQHDGVEHEAAELAAAKVVEKRPRRLGDVGDAAWRKEEEVNAM